MGHKGQGKGVGRAGRGVNGISRAKAERMRRRGWGSGWAGVARYSTYQPVIYFNIKQYKTKGIGMGKRITVTKNAAMGCTTFSDKSINPKKQAVTGVFDIFNDALECRFREVFGFGSSSPAFKPNNAPASGINPQDSTETKVLI